MQQAPTIHRDKIARFAALLRRWLRFVFSVLLRFQAIPERAALDVMEQRTRKLILARAMELIELPNTPRRSMRRRTRRPGNTPAGFRRRRGGRDVPSCYMRLALPSLRHLKPDQQLRMLEHAHANLDTFARRLIARIAAQTERAPFIIAAPRVHVLTTNARSPAPACADTS